MVLFLYLVFAKKKFYLQLESCMFKKGFLLSDSFFLLKIGFFFENEAAYRVYVLTNKSINRTCQNN